APIRYIYDFGDNWVHRIDAQTIGDPAPGNLYPRLTDIIGRCPPEDVGGLPGYEDFLDAVSDPNHPEHENMIRWAGGPFDPHVPDADELRLEVLKLAKKWKPRKK
ncbi:plasmid pRiA4b ORF-3 family protein, partial [Albimonas pacifica]